MHLSEVAFILIISAIALARGQETTSFVFGRSFSTSTNPGAKTLTLSLPASKDLYLNSSSTLDLTVSYVVNGKNDAAYPSVSLELLYANRSTAFLLSDGMRSTSTPLCFEAPRLEMEALTIVMSAGSVVDLEFNLVVADLELKFNSEVETEITPGLPATFLVDPVTGGSMKDRYLLRVENSGNLTEQVCMVVTAYSNHCPYKNQLSNFRSADMWFTALTKGAMTIRNEEFEFGMPFYVSVLILENDDLCRLEQYRDGHPMVANRTKKVRIEIERLEKYTSYMAPISVVLICTILTCCVALCIMLGKRYDEDDMFSPDPDPDGPAGVIGSQGDDKSEKFYSPNESREQLPDFDLQDGARTNTTDGTDFRGLNESLKPMLREQNGADAIDTAEGEGEREGGRCMANAAVDDLKERCRSAIPADSTRLRRIEKGLERLNNDAKLSQMTEILSEDAWFRRNRSRVYCYLVPLLSLFYFIPSIQFVFLVKESESLTGSQDLCYHNFLCAKPWSIFSDFNHVISNVPYMIYGAVFIGLVRLKASKLPKDQNPKHDHKSGKGILQQLSIFYAMGFALIAQGFFSICYHVCPTNHSLQFDSTMMYVMCMLGIVKIYQFRHPDANANAYSFFFFLGSIVLLEALTIYTHSWIIYGLFLLLYVSMTIFIAIDCYFIGIGRLDSRITKELARDIVFNSWKGGVDGKFRKVRYPKRFFFALSFCLVNFFHAFYSGISKYYNPQKSVTHVVLGILAGNLFLYILYYVFRKNRLRWTALCARCKEEGLDDIDAKYTYPNPCCTERRIPMFVSAGSFYALLAFAFGITAITFYLSRNANRNLSPAESRNLNADCAYLDFYDAHDLWHFFSASAIFMAFLALLTVDDDQLHVPRDQIEVF